MQAGAGGFADGVETGQIGAPAGVAHDTATGVVGGGYHRQGLFRHVVAEVQAAGMDVGEVFANEGRRLVADVEIDELGTDALHFVVDGAGDDVAWRQLAPRVKTLHEGRAVGQAQDPAFAADGLGNEEGFGLRMIEAGGMELVELHVGHAAAGAPGHGDAVAGGGIGVAGIEIDLAGATGGQHHVPRGIGVHVVVTALQHVGAETAVRPAIPQLARGNEIHGDMVFADVDIAVLAHALLEGGLQRATGGIGGMHHAAVGVAALAGQVPGDPGGGIGGGGEGDPLFLQPADGGRPAGDDLAHHLLLAQARTRRQRIGDVGFDGILGGEHRGNSALRVEGAAVFKFTFGNQADRMVFGEVQGEAEAGGAAADDQDVVGVRHGQAMSVGLRVLMSAGFGYSGCAGSRLLYNGGGAGHPPLCG